ncbi:hypothetical protein AB0G54_37120 [Streptomyces yokosukanensis]|uniref:hypothetical protein n=1 Tax=Streptomyces yokosukanensis TaxID=67386 RepID=UPI0034338B81
MQWFDTIAGNLVLLAAVVLLLNGFYKQQPAKFVTAFICAGVGYALLSGNLNDFVSREILGETSPPHPATSGNSGEADGLSFPTWLLWPLLGVIVSAAAAASAARLFRRRRHRADRRGAIEADHNEVRDAYAAYVCDILAVLDRPALDDVQVPQTAAFLHAMDAADHASRGDDLDAYRQAVSELKTAWRAADEHARKTGTRHLPDRERTAIGKARALFEKALDQRGSEHERRAAYAKARELLDGVLVIPRQAAAELEDRRRLALTKADHPVPERSPRT